MSDRWRTADWQETPRQGHDCRVIAFYGGRAVSPTGRPWQCEECGQRWYRGWWWPTAWIRWQNPPPWIRRRPLRTRVSYAAGWWMAR